MPRKIDPPSLTMTDGIDHSAVGSIQKFSFKLTLFFLQLTFESSADLRIRARARPLAAVRGFREPNDIQGVYSLHIVHILKRVVEARRGKAVSARSQIEIRPDSCLSRLGSTSSVRMGTMNETPICHWVKSKPSPAASGRAPAGFDSAEVPVSWRKNSVSWP